MNKTSRCILIHHMNYTSYVKYNYTQLTHDSYRRIKLNINIILNTSTAHTISFTHLFSLYWNETQKKNKNDSEEEERRTEAIVNIISLKRLIKYLKKN